MIDRIENWFLSLGATWLTIGMGWGLHMGASHDFTYAPVHAHLNLVGGVLHLVFGIAYKLWPNLKARPLLTRIHAYLFMGVTPFFAAGIFLTIKSQSEGLAVIASILIFAGMAAFCLNAWRALREA